jgi:hypothetical protein
MMEKLQRREELRNGSQTWWGMPVIPALGKLRQEDLKFQANLGYTKKSKQKTQIKGQKNIANKILKYYPLTYMKHV